MVVGSKRSRGGWKGRVRAVVVWLDVLAATQRFGGSNGSNGAATSSKGWRQGKLAAAATEGEEGGAVGCVTGAGSSKRAGKKGSR